jgi:hypothetical protein
MKQETIEEAAERLFSEKKYPTEFKTLRTAFVSNAKWQAERIYSQDYLQGFIDQFGDGDLGELSPKEWDALAFLKWLKLNNFEIIKKK